MLRALLAFLLLAPLAHFAAAEGGTIGLSPADIRLTSAQKGEEYVRRLVVSNQFDSPTTITITPEGDAGGWIRTDPPSGFVIPPQDRAEVVVVVRIPHAAENGTHLGILRVLAESKQSPDSSGFALRYGAAVRINATIGGEAVQAARLTEANAEDVEVGTVPVATARVRNEGNVNTTFEVVGEVLDAAGNVLLTVRIPVKLRPGEEVDVPVAFAQSLPPGTYRLRLETHAPAGVTREIRDFKVVPAGTLGKDGRIVELRAPMTAQAGLPVRVTATFENTGTATITRAQLVGELTRGETVVGAFESQSLLVPVGGKVNLTAFVTPLTSGKHEIRARVVYDGFETLPSRALVEMQGEAATASVFSLQQALPWALGGVVACLLLLLWRRRKKDAE